MSNIEEDNDPDDRAQPASPLKPKKPAMSEAERKKERLARALRANLARRKDQARARRAGNPDERAPGLVAAVPVSDDPGDAD